MKKLGATVHDLGAELRNAERRVEDIKARMVDASIGYLRGEKLLTLRHGQMGTFVSGGLKRELVTAGFKSGDEVVIIKRSTFERVETLLAATGLKVEE